MAFKSKIVVLAVALSISLMGLITSPTPSSAESQQQISQKVIVTSKLKKCKLNGQKLKGKVFIASSSIFADFDVYVAKSSIFADVVVFPTTMSFDTRKCGHWYFTTFQGEADFSVYFVRSQIFADFTISLTNSSIFAGLNK